MSDVSLELQKAIYARLLANDDLAALICDRVYDHVPRKDGKVTAIFPFVSFGPERELPEAYDCLKASEFILQIDVWSQGVGFPEVKQIAGLVSDALDDADLRIGGHALAFMSYDGRNIMRDPDGLTSHAVLTFRAAVEKAFPLNSLSMGRERLSLGGNALKAN